MPPIRSSKNRKPPLRRLRRHRRHSARILQQASRTLRMPSHEGKKKHEMVWPVFRDHSTYVSHTPARSVSSFWPLFPDGACPAPTAYCPLQSADSAYQAQNTSTISTTRRKPSPNSCTRLLKNNYADKNLIAKWKKQGYEKICRISQLFSSAADWLSSVGFRCIQTKETNFNSTCICRVPRRQLKEDCHSVVNCGCRGCGSSD